MATEDLPRTAWPMMTEARPATIMPMPMPTSAKPWYWAMSAPHRATRPFERASPRSFWWSVFTPNDRIMSGLSPVARIARPTSVCRNHTMSPRMTSATARKIPTLAKVPTSLSSRSGSNNVGWCRSGTFALPMIRRLIEYSATCVRMPASRPLMRPRVCSRPVTSPAAMPPTSARDVASAAGMPFTMPTAAIEAPVVKLPSTVRSGKSRMRKVRYTPRAITA